jgi:hypothetical protein
VRHTSYEKRYRRNFTECDIDPWISGKPQECALKHHMGRLID